MIGCPVCNYFFTDGDIDNEISRCPGCARTIDMVVFPALKRASVVTKGTGASDDDAQCAYHAANQADTVCARCGRLICSLCALPLGKQTVCPECLQRNVVTKNIKSGIVVWDSLALMLVAHPVMIPMFFFSFMTAPLSLILSIIFFNKEFGPVKRGKWRFTVAILLSLLIIGLWIFLLIVVLDKVKK